MEAVMSQRESMSEELLFASDPVSALRASVERILIPVETRLNEWESELPKAIAGPQVTPALRERLTALRASTERCRELAETMLADLAVEVDSEESSAGGGDSE